MKIAASANVVQAASWIPEVSAAALALQDALVAEILILALLAILDTFSTKRKTASVVMLLVAQIAQHKECVLHVKATTS